MEKGKDRLKEELILMKMEKELNNNNIKKLFFKMENNLIYTLLLKHIPMEK